ncbi:SRPBCC family protein [Patulibacter sp. SYSU D01012]|uniref:SRPBCC family protein n=1 Tax=Patulibacter sp. SYSU D01012 TaxID=2817381 RepID=UPI001B313F7D
MLRYEARCAAAPAVVWPLLACPARWEEWAPHVRGAWGLGEREVRAGAWGAVLLFGLAPVPVRVTAVDPGRSWTWRAGLLTVRHRVDPLDGGHSVVGLDLSAPRPLELALRATYGPVCRWVVAALARRAAAEPPPGAGGW